MDDRDDRMDPYTVRKLVNRVKACTFLPYVNDGDWTTDVLSAVEVFVTDAERPMLCLYYESGVLKAAYSIPGARTDTIAWFLKTAADGRVDPANFLKSVSFGKIDAVVEKSVFLLLDSLYSPFVFSWTANEKDRFFEQYRAVVQDVCSLRYKLLGMPSIYIPPIVGNFDETSTSEETLRVLENILHVYTLEIQKCLTDTERIPSRCEYMMEHIVDELDYWKNRLRNLRFISALLSYKSVDEILAVLKRHRSIVVRSFHNIIAEIETAKTESISNLGYLQTLREPIASLYDVKSPDDILNRLPDIFVRFVFVFEESPYYNKRSDVNRLYEYLGNQIVFVCRKTVKLSELFAGDAASVSGKLRTAMDCCENYISAYAKAIEIYNRTNDGRWSVETKAVRMFLDRCRDVRYVCESMVLFKRLDGNHPKPRFSFGNGSEFEMVVESVESRFDKLVADLETVQNVVFNVNTADWYQHELEFKEEVNALCATVERLLNDSLSVTCNVQDALNVLQTLHYFARWPRLRSHFRNKTNEVCATLVDDVSLSAQFYAGHRYQIPSAMVRHSGVCAAATVEYKRITALKNTISERAWLLPCTNMAKLRRVYKSYATAYRQLMRGTFELWLDGRPNVGDAVAKRNVLAGNQPGHNYWHLAVNLDCDTLDAATDVEYWSLIGLGGVFKPNRVAANVKRLYRDASKIVNDYNSLVAGLSEQEMLLFSDSIDACNKITSPMTDAYTWTHSDMNSCLVDCFDELESSRRFVDVYKRCNVEIVDICEQIANLTLFQIDRARIMELKDLRAKIETVKSDRIIKIVEKYDLIVKYVTVIYEGFKDSMDNIVVYWTRYVKRIDELIREALILNCRRSLENVLELSVGDGSGPAPVILIRVSLNGNKVEYSSSLSEMLAFSANFFADILTAVRLVPRLSGAFGPTDTDWPSYGDDIAKDRTCAKLQETYDTETINALRRLRHHMREILSFERIWSTDKNAFFQKYGRFECSAIHFNQDITRYTVYKRQISLIKPVAQVAHFLVRINALKDGIVEHCDEWINRFSDLLLETTTDLIDGLYRYAQTNSRRAMTPPTNLSEMISFVELRRNIVLEYDDKAKEFSQISDNMRVLEMNNVGTPETMKDKYEKLFGVWSTYKNTLEDAEIMLIRKRNEFANSLMEKRTGIKIKAKNLSRTFLETAPISTEWKSNDALNYIERMQNTLSALQTEEKQLSDDLAVFGMEYVYSIETANLQEEISVLHSVWKLVNTWDSIWGTCKATNFWAVRVSDVKATVDAFFDRFGSVADKLTDKKWEVLETTRNDVDEFRSLLPVVEDLKNPALKARHWDDVRTLTNKKFDETSADFTLGSLTEMKMGDFRERIRDISTRSSAELGLENAIGSIKETWSGVTLPVETYKDKGGGVCYVRATDDVFRSLEDHLTRLSVIKTSKHISVFLPEADALEKSLGLVAEVLETVLSVQRQHIYLENIFAGDDIRQKLPMESIDYDILTEEWKVITARMRDESNLFEACNSKPLYKHLNTMNYRLEAIQRALEVYMESKRRVFPRFYFISNRELLEISGNSKNPDSVRPHLGKLFDNIRDVKILTNNSQKKEARGMFSGDGEYVDWNRPVLCDGPAETWLRLIEAAMRDSLRQTLKQARLSLAKNLKAREKWIMEWPGQLCIIASQIQWTADCTRALLRSKNVKHKYPLKRAFKKQNKMLTRLSKLVRGTVDNGKRAKVTALIIVEAHARDAIERLYKSDCTDASAFEWLSQLRFYWDKKANDVIVKQTNAKQAYGYEYLGNSGRLVITPLTDRCYVTLTAAVHMCRGGNLKGFACTGKTETVKDLGKHLGRYVVVVNCSAGVDYKSVGRTLLGLAQQGAWGCFDDVRRTTAGVLSSVTQQISSIFSALAANSKTLTVGNETVALVPTCGVFVTTCPGGGHSNLPDDFVSLFRAASMIVPDRRLIAETVLFGEGFKDAACLANRLCVFLSLRQELLSKRNHYDHGLGGLIRLIKYVGKLKRENPKVPDDEIICTAIDKTSLANITKDDSPIFTAIKNHSFPDVTPSLVPRSDDDVYLIDAVKRTMLRTNRRPTESAVTKIVQLYEMKRFRRSVILTGRSGAAKSTTWKTLRDASVLLNSERVNAFETVVDYILNPKTLTIDELYGKYNRVTHEWMDGVLSSIMRKICSDNGSEEKWVIFDGPIDSGWVENMSSAMDDNKLLMLANGERIRIPKQVSFIFEVDNLEEASPAIVSRCGVIFNDHNDYNWRLYVDSWLNGCKFKLFRDSMTLHFDQYVSSLLAFKRSNCVELFSLTDQNCIISLCNLLECCTFDDLGDKVPNGLNDSQYAFLVKIWFIFCMIWSVCGCVNEEGKKKIDVYIRGVVDAFPIRDTVYHYYVDNNYCKFKHWEEKLSVNKWTYNTETTFSEIVVPTIDTVRYGYLIRLRLSKNQPILLVGPRGCGKTSNAYNSFKNMNKKKFSFLNVHMTAQTTSNDVQEMIEEKLEKRTKELYIPLTGRTMVAFLDDLHMPVKETSGAQPPLELIRQWVDYGFWYDKKNRCPRYVKNMRLVCAMTLFDKLEHCISDRITRCFNVISVKTPEDDDIYNIYKTILGQHLTDFDETVSELGGRLTLMTMSLYKHLVINMIPTPVKIHYLFSLKDISKVFQGLLRSNVKYQNFKVPMLRLWCHEVFRVFYDRLVDDNDQKWFLNQINDELEHNYNLTYRDLCTSRQNPIFCSFLNENALYEEVVDEEYLKRFIEDGIREYNLNSEFAPVDILLFRDYIEHVCRIVRVISQPMGHILLVGIGGTGRSSLGKIASWLCNYSIFTIELAKSYGPSEFKKDLKLIYTETGLKNQPTSFLFNDTQIVDDSFLKIIHNILSTGEVTKLFNENEFEEIKKTLLENTKTSVDVESTGEVTSSFIDRIKNNLHLILSFSPVQTSFRIRLQQYPSLTNFTTIDWFLDWPKEALLEVATTSLSDFDVLTTITGESRVHGTQNEETTRDKFKNSLASIFASIHHSVIEYSKQVELNYTNNVTHAMYLEMITRYKETLRAKRIEKQNTSMKLRNGLQRINDTSRKINDMTTELEKVAELITARTKQCEEMFAVISKYLMEIDEQKSKIDSICTKIKADELKCQEMYDLALSELKHTVPELEEATNKICTLGKKDLSEIKCFSVPPEGVKLVLEAVMTLKQSDTSWAETKRQLDDPNFLIQLKDFDKDRVTDSVFKQIDSIIRSPEFDLEKIGTKSTAAKYLGAWVIAIEKYAKMYRSVMPKRTSADLAMSIVKEEQTALEVAKENLVEKQTLLEKQKLEYDETVIKKENVIAKAEELKSKLEKSSKLIDGLSEERKKWNKTVNQIDTEFDHLPGDCVLSTAFVSYMGPFNCKCREFLTNLWLTFMKENGAFNNPNFEVTLFLTDPETIRNWNVHGLSNDKFSLENGIIISQCYRHPFIIDPQNLAWKWIENIELDNGLKIIDYRSENSARNLEIALQNGYPTLMRIDLENIDPHVVSILSNPVVKQKNKLFIRMNNKLLPYNKTFRIFMTTNIKNTRCLPEIIARTAIVDFTIQRECLEELLLKTLVNIENPSLEELKDNTIINIEKDKKSLIEIQDELIKLLNDSECSLLENEQLLQTLRSSKATFSVVKEQLQSSLTSQAEIYIAREGYRPCAKRASILYFILDGLDKMNPMYRYSLDYYVAVFKRSIKKSNAAEQLHERITNLNNYHTYAVYENICRGLFERHKLIFSFQICIEILISENELDADEFEFLLNGAAEPTDKRLVTAQCPDWLPAAYWNSILALSHLPGFRKLDESFEEFSTEWSTWYLAPEPENLRLIGRWENECSLFQRLLIVRSLRLDRLSFSIKHFISKKLGPPFSEAPIFDFKTIRDDLNNKNAVIFILSPGADPKTMLIDMAKSCNKEDKFQSLSLGNGLESIATDLIETGQKEGHWIFLANCHLLLSWIPQLDKIIENMRNQELHPEFRMLLSSKPHPKFPTTLLQNAIKVSTDRPKNLRSNLLYLYRNFNEEQFTQNESFDGKYEKILFNLCLFHCILVGRHKFRNLGWNEIYDFSDSDFKTSKSILSVYLNEYEETPWSALKYLIGSIFYGGNVTDVWDKRLLETYTNQYFNDNAMTSFHKTLSSLTDGHVPADGPLQSCKHFAESLPCTDSARTFGQHPNADVVCLTKENRSLCETLKYLREQSNGSPSADDKDKNVLRQLYEIGRNMPALIRRESVAENVETNILDSIVSQEVTRYNNLLKEMKMTLTTLEKGITGQIVIPPDLENALRAIYEHKVPNKWLKTYPSSMDLGAWMEDLIGRVKYFTAWTSTSQPPVSVWLGAFTFPTSFLTYVLQNESKRSSVRMDLLGWDFVPISTPLNDLTAPPAKGAYVHNLYLEGAGWDDRNLCLREPLPLEAIAKLPAIHFLPVEGKRRLKDLYRSPVYYCPKRNGTRDGNASVVLLNLKTGPRHPDHWIKRATAVLLNLGG